MTVILEPVVLETTQYVAVGLLGKKSVAPLEGSLHKREPYS